MAQPDSVLFIMIIPCSLHCYVNRQIKQQLSLFNTSKPGWIECFAEIA